MQGIDVSKWQGNMQLDKAIDYVIIRAGYGVGHKDPMFEAFYNKAKALGIKVGCYWYSYAKGLEQAKKEAESFLNTIKGKQFEMPVFVDVEEGAQFEIGANYINALIDVYGQVMEKAGYAFGYYMSEYYAKRYVSRGTNEKYIFWCAKYSTRQPDINHRVDIWQHTSKWYYQKQYVDHNISYRNFDWIKSKGYNGFGR